MKKLKRYKSLPMGLRKLINEWGVEKTLKAFSSLEGAFRKVGDEDEAMRAAKTQREIREAIEWPLPADTIH